VITRIKDPSAYIRANNSAPATNTVAAGVSEVYRFLPNELLALTADYLGNTYAVGRRSLGTSYALVRISADGIATVLAGDRPFTSDARPLFGSTALQTTIGKTPLFIAVNGVGEVFLYDGLRNGWAVPKSTTCVPNPSIYKIALSGAVSHFAGRSGGPFECENNFTPQTSNLLADPDAANALLTDVQGIASGPGNQLLVLRGQTVYKIDMETRALFLMSGYGQLSPPYLYGNAVSEVGQAVVTDVFYGSTSIAVGGDAIYVSSDQRCDDVYGPEIVHRDQLNCVLNRIVNSTKFQDPVTKKFAYSTEYPPWFQVPVFVGLRGNNSQLIAGRQGVEAGKLVALPNGSLIMIGAACVGSDIMACSMRLSGIYSASALTLIEPKANPLDANVVGFKIRNEVIAMHKAAGYSMTFPPVAGALDPFTATISYPASAASMISRDVMIGSKIVSDAMPFASAYQRLASIRRIVQRTPTLVVEFEPVLGGNIVASGSLPLFLNPTIGASTNPFGQKSKQTLQDEAIDNAMAVFGDADDFRFDTPVAIDPLHIRPTIRLRRLPVDLNLSANADDGEPQMSDEQLEDINVQIRKVLDTQSVSGVTTSGSIRDGVLEGKMAGTISLRLGGYANRPGCQNNGFTGDSRGYYLDKDPVSRVSVVDPSLFQPFFAAYQFCGELGVPITLEITEARWKLDASKLRQTSVHTVGSFNGTPVAVPKFSGDVAVDAAMLAKVKVGGKINFLYEVSLGVEFQAPVTPIPFSLFGEFRHGLEAGAAASLEFPWTPAFARTYTFVDSVVVSSVGANPTLPTAQTKASWLELGASGKLYAKTYLYPLVGINIGRLLVGVQTPLTAGLLKAHVGLEAGLEAAFNVKLNSAQGLPVKAYVEFTPGYFQVTSLISSPLYNSGMSILRDKFCPRDPVTYARPTWCAVPPNLFIPVKFGQTFYPNGQYECMTISYKQTIVGAYPKVTNSYQLGVDPACKLSTPINSWK
jgi:hypothetical protein